MCLVGPIDDYAVHQLNEFGGKMLTSTTNEGLDIEDQDEKKKVEDLRAEVEPSTKLMKEVLGDKVAGLMRHIRPKPGDEQIIFKEYDF